MRPDCALYIRVVCCAMNLTKGGPEGFTSTGVAVHGSRHRKLLCIVCRRGNRRLVKKGNVRYKVRVILAKLFVDQRCFPTSSRDILVPPACFK
jgi:hypothetical protein